LNNSSRELLADKFKLNYEDLFYIKLGGTIDMLLIRFIINDIESLIYLRIGDLLNDYQMKIRKNWY